MEILLVDDEPQIRTVLRAYLEADGFAVHDAATGREALDALGMKSGSPFALALLDLGLPDVDGLDLLVRMRAVDPGLPVIVVTARAEEAERIMGLAAGADDYVVKPFRPREVVARVRAVLRRCAPPRVDRTTETEQPTDPAETTDPERLVFDDLVIDRGRREVERDGAPVPLSTLEFDILRTLADAPGRVYTRAQLLERVWGYAHLGDERVVDVHVRNIRRRLRDNAGDPQVIGTVRGVGYKFIPRPPRRRSTRP